MLYAPVAGNDDYLEGQQTDKLKESQHLFAMLHNEVAISETQYEGANPQDALTYYQFLLELELPDCPLDFNLDPTLLQSIKTKFSVLSEINEWLAGTPEDILKEPDFISDELIKKIKDVCEEHGCCYLPSGWQNLTGGHFVALKIRKLTHGDYAFSIINRGAGLSYHRKLEKTGTQEKPCYQSDEYEVDLDSANANELLQHLLELSFDKERQAQVIEEVVNPFNEHDLYGLLEIHGNKLGPADKLEEKAVTPQYSGTCTITNAHTVALDTLIDEGTDFDTRARYHFVLKLRSFIAGFYQYRLGNYPRDILEWSLREFAVRVNQQYAGILSEDEVTYCRELHAELSAKLQEDAADELAAKNITVPLPDLVGAAPRDYDETKAGLLTPLPKAEKPKARKYSSYNKPQSIKPAYTIEEVCERIHDWFIGKNFSYLFDFFMDLPICSGETSDLFWDQMDQEEIHLFLDDLLSRVQRVTKREYVSDIDRAKHFLLSLIAYDIAAQIAPRCPQLNISTNYALALDTIYLEQCFYRDPVVYHRIKHLAENFVKRAEGKERVFSNAVISDDDEHDSTINYIIRVVLNEKQRSALARAKMKKVQVESASYNDVELFKFLMKYPGCKDENNEPILNKYEASLLQLSGMAHNLGRMDFDRLIGSYIKDEHKQIWYFNRTRFHQALNRHRKFNIQEVNKPIPILERSPELHQDLAENTIFHPTDDLSKKRDKYKEYKTKDTYSSEIEYSNTLELHAYNLYPSGATNPNARIWELSDIETIAGKNSGYAQQLLEELNEDFRSIECSPDFQVVRVLAWGKNNLDKLDLEIVRTRMSELVFQFGKLDQSLANHPQATVKLIEEFLHEAYRYYQTEEMGHDYLIWLNDLTHDLRNYVEVSAKQCRLSLESINWLDNRALIWEELKRIKDSDIRSRFASQLVNSFLNSSTLSSEDVNQIVCARVIANFGENSSYSDDAWKVLVPDVEKSMKKSPRLFSRNLRTLFYDYTGFEISDLEKRNNNLVAKDGRFAIDLVQGKFCREGSLQNVFERTAKTFSENKAFFAKLNLYENEVRLYYSEYPHILKSSDEKWEFDYKIIGETEQTFNIIAAYKKSRFRVTLVNLNF